MTHSLALIIVAFWLAHLLAVISPGPSLLVVIRSSVAVSRTAGIFNAAGFAIGSVIWATIAMLGLNILFTAFPWIYSVVRIGGGLYLIYLSLKMVNSDGMTDHPDTRTPIIDESFASSLLKGFAIQISNPKVVIFMGSILTSLVPKDAPSWLLAVILIIVFSNELLWYSFVAYSFSIKHIRVRYSRISKYADRAAGVFLAGMGLRIIVS